MTDPGDRDWHRGRRDGDSRRPFDGFIAANRAVIRAVIRAARIVVDFPVSADPVFHPHPRAREELFRS